MRKSRVLLAGVAVAAAAAATSAFTASNTITTTAQQNVVGYGQVTVTGATISNIVYTPLAADKSKLDTVVFTSTTDVVGQTATMILKNAGAVVLQTTCSVGTTYSTTVDITCTATGNPLLDSFDTVGLTIVH
ncbi:MAG TPA: hypothetical protein VGN28_14965 [Blastococcus sp.]|jgi:hypothetical protein|nr:hypothetical protein [Blastococcus sp.]